MHRHSLYKICPSKASSLSALTDNIMLMAKLPASENTREKVNTKCASLIIESALKWEENGLLLQRGHSLGKRKVLREVWADHVGRFHELETAIFGVVSLEGQGCDSSSTDVASGNCGGSNKVSSSRSPVVTLTK